MSVSFRPIQKQDLEDVTSVYNYYVTNSTATFHLEPISEKEMAKSLDLEDDSYPAFIVLLNNEMVGFCYFNRFRKKEAYDISAEVTLYLKAKSVQKGVGKSTLKFLETQAHELGFKNLIGVITSENEGSIQLFEKCGYSKAAHLKNIGVKFNRTLDVVWYQKEI